MSVASSAGAIVRWTTDDYELIYLRKTISKVRNLSIGKLKLDASQSHWPQCTYSSVFVRNAGHWFWRSLRRMHTARNRKYTSHTIIIANGDKQFNWHLNAPFETCRQTICKWKWKKCGAPVPSVVPSATINNAKWIKLNNNSTRNRNKFGISRPRRDGVSRVWIDDQFRLGSIANAWESIPLPSATLHSSHQPVAIDVFIIKWWVCVAISAC